MSLLLFYLNFKYFTFIIDTFVQQDSVDHIMTKSKAIGTRMRENGTLILTEFEVLVHAFTINCPVAISLASCIHGFQFEYVVDAIVNNGRVYGLIGRVVGLRLGELYHRILHDTLDGWDFARVRLGKSAIGLAGRDSTVI